MPVLESNASAVAWNSDLSLARVTELRFHILYFIEIDKTRQSMM